MAWGHTTRVRRSNLLNEFMVTDLPTGWLEVPGKVLLSRLFYEEHSVEIKELIAAKGLLNIKIEVLVFRHQLEAAGIDPDHPNFDVTKPKPPGVHFYSIFGAHSTGAALSLHLNRPKHADWLTCPVIMHVCEDTEENRSLAQVYGGIDNLVHDSQKKVDHWDVTASLHQARLTIEASGRSKPDRKLMWAKAKTDIKSRSSVPNQATMGSLESLSGHMGQTWDLLYQIMMGQCPDVKQKKIVKPINLAWTKDMSNIPANYLIRWLKRVVTGEYATKDFITRCGEYKKQQRVQNDITDYVNQMRPGDEHKDFSSVCRKYVAFQVKATFDTMVRWCGAVAKDKLNSYVQDKVHQILVDHDRGRGMEVEEVSFVFLNVF